MLQNGVSPGGSLARLLPQIVNNSQSVQLVSLASRNAQNQSVQQQAGQYPRRIHNERSMVTSPERQQMVLKAQLKKHKNTALSQVVHDLAPQHSSALLSPSVRASAQDSKRLQM